jgi:formylglycine-generating enzyme required for sulfatase activity/predicted Ser/Thr protein kinase
VTPERWERVKQLFEQALEKPPADRVEFLRKVCDGDPALQVELESLMAEEEIVGDFMDMPAIRPQESLAGKMILDYQVIRKLGEGGMGVVYQARDTRLDRFVALKMLPPETMSDPDRRRRFVREAKAASALNHPNIVTVYDIVRHNDVDFIVMEYVDGINLQEVLRGSEVPTLIQRMKVMSQVAAGLHYAHERGIIHRDVKPANIMVATNGNVKILDFGIARMSNSDTTANTDQGSLVGTLQWMSPEQLRGTGEVDALCDIWAYGATYYAVLTGRPPFEATDNASLIYKITLTDPEPIGPSASDCPPALSEIVMRALAKERKARYQSLENLRADTEPVLLDLKREQVWRGAAEAMQCGGGGAARDALRHMIDRDPTNLDARELYEGISDEARWRAIQPRLEALLGDTDKDLTQNRGSQIVPVIAEASELSPETPLDPTGRAKPIAIRSSQTGFWVAGGVLTLALAIGGVWTYRDLHVPANPVAIAMPSVTAQAPSPDPNVEAAFELAFWNSIRDSSDVRVYREYLAKYPSGRFASLARLKLPESAESHRTGFRPPLPLTHRPGEPRLNPRDGLLYVWIPAGQFEMGCSPEDDECLPEEKPRHTVRLTRGFWLGTTEVTNEAWTHFVEQSPRGFRPSQADARMPVIDISWNDARSYCAWAGGRLPTEAEWEYGERAGATKARYGPLNDIAWFRGNSGRRVQPVAGRQPNAWGLYDMLGNVFEWVNDWFGSNYYAVSPEADPRGPDSGSSRVARGGRADNYANFIRASSKWGWLPTFRGHDQLGCRCALDEIPAASRSAGRSTCVAPPSGIIAWWRLDEPSGALATDSIGTETATYSGTPPPVQTQGLVGGGLKFNGSNYLSAPSPSWHFGNNDFTIELWANFAVVPGGSLVRAGAVFVGNDDGPGAQDKWFFAVGGGLLNFTVYNKMSPPPNGCLARAPFSPVVGKWYHLAVTKSGTTFTTYVNGVAVGSEMSRSPIARPSAPLTIGQAEGLGFMNGTLDEVAIYDRALSAAELLAITNAAGAGKCKTGTR